MCTMEKVFINPYHSSSLLHSISKLWKEEKFFDAKIEIGKHVFKVHKLVLVASSPRFLQVAENLTQDGRLDVQLPSDTDLNSMKLFITYLYEGVIKLTNSNLKFIEKIAALFQVTKLLQFCEEFKIHVQREEHNAKKRKLSKPIICQCPSCMSDNSESGQPCDSARVMERLRHKINVHSKKETVVIDSDGDHSSVDECISQIKKSLVKEGLSPLARDVRPSLGQKVVQSVSKQRRSSRIPKRKQFSEDFCDNLDAPLFMEKKGEEEDSDNHSSDETTDDIYNPSEEDADADDFEEEISNIKTKKTYPNLKKMRQIMSGEVEHSAQQNKLKVSSDIFKGNALRISSAAAGQSSVPTLQRDNLTKFKQQGELDCSTKEQHKEIKIEPLSSSLDQSASMHSSSQHDKPALMSLLTGPPLLKPRDATIKEPFTSFKYGPQACEIPPKIVKTSTKPNISDDKEICQDSEPNQDNENVEDFVVRKVKEEPLDSVYDSNENAEPVIYSASQTGLKPISTSDNFCSGREAVYRGVHETDGGHVHAQMMEHSRRLDLDNESSSDNKRTSIKSESTSSQESRDIQVSEMFSPKHTVVSPIKPRQQISHSEPHPVTLITAAGQKFDLLSLRQQDMAKTQKAKYFFQGDPKLRRLEQRRIYSRQHRAKRNASKIRYKCIECHKLFKEKVHVKIHMRTHNGYKPYICQVCDHRSGTKDNLKRHVILRHKEVNVHELNFDVETIDSIQDTPMEIVHIGVEGDSNYSLKRQRDPEALCQECGKYFTSKYVLKKHITNIHGQVRPYLCPFCNTKTYKIENLKTHITLTHKVNLASLDSYFKEIGPKRCGSRRKRDGKKSNKEGSESCDH
ncbi:hypothetical protein ACJMK2_020338 [Sinanodonta woodiana]|uniref:Uncharacterized protein n=1 Tax=Sinanodonta woodiana TaxID=1069815 RepID=A0ABD3U1A6_SINWO